MEIHCGESRYSASVANQFLWGTGLYIKCKGSVSSGVWGGM